MSYEKHYSVRKTPQSEAIPGKDMTRNAAGGFGFQIDDWARLDRFLMLGTEGGTYYVSERGLTIDACKTVQSLIETDGLRVVNRIVEISQAGRAHKNDAALFALAMASAFGDEQTRKLAYGVLPQVARIGTHLFQFALFRESLGGWGRGMRRAVSNWYNQKKPDSLAYQLLKYRQRNGWSHRDMLRLSHPVTDSEVHRLMYDVTCRPEKIDGHLDELPSIYTAFINANVATAKAIDIAKAIREAGLTREMVPTEHLNDIDVWEALLEKMPMMATIRNLGKMTSIGLLKPLSSEVDLVVDRLTNEEALQKARIHPVSILLALRTYASGGGHRGSLNWSPVPAITDAFNDAYYKSFEYVEPCGKRFVLGVDVSGSMDWSAGGTILSCAEVTAAMAMTIARTEPKSYIHGFASGFRDLGITPNVRLDDAMRRTRDMNFGSTDCAVPMLWALQSGIQADCFVVLTDNDTWHGNIHPVQALEQYRRETGIPAKLVVLGMRATNISIADPNDAGMLDIAGFDTSVPSVISDFCR